MARPAPPTPSPAPAAPDEAPLDAPASTVLDSIEPPVAAAVVTTTSGRRYEIDADHDRDRLVVRGAGGDVVLRVEITDQGPVLSFSGAVVELAASRRLSLSADAISIAAARDIVVDVGGSLRETVAGDHHLRAGGDERVEARKVELQASVGGVSVKAMEKIALDGEHIGLNDDPAPAPFPWSAIADGPDDDSG